MSDCLFCSACGAVAVPVGRSRLVALVHAEATRCDGGYAAVAIWEGDCLSLVTVPELVRL